MSTRLFTRVAVVQLAAHPAIASKSGHSPLEDPLFGAGPPDTLVPEGEPTPELDARFKTLRARVRAAYLEHLRAKVGAVLERCLEWGVRVVVFPEYSIPCDLLAFVAGYSASTRGDLVIVAGTHTVDRDARKRGPYKALGAPEAPPLGQAVCPVLHRGRFIALQPKLNPAAPEAGQMKPGDHWAPVTLPDGTPGPMGILVCLDFLYRENGPHRTLVGEALESCRFLAVPSWTPPHTLSEFASKAWEEARRYGRPVLYANTAGLGTNEGGGTSIFVDEGRPSDLRNFPKHVGLFDVGEEGIIVADVDLGFRRSGESRHYNWEPPVRPFAAASLVYQNHPASAAYASWLEEAASTLADDSGSVEDFSDHVAASETLLQNAASLGGPMRGRRLRRMLREHGGFIDIEQFRLSTREVVLPEEALPLPIVRAAMAGAASDVVFEWLKEYRHVGLAELAERLRRAGEGASRVDAAEWTESARHAIGTLRAVIVGDELRPSPIPAPPAPTAREIAVIPAGIDPASLGERERNGLRFQFRARAEDFTAELNAEAARRPGGQDALAKALAQSAYDIWRARELLLLASAESGEHCAVVGVSPAGGGTGGLGALAASRGPGPPWVLYHIATTWWKSEAERVQAALEEEGLRPIHAVVLSDAESKRRKAALRALFAGALTLAVDRRAFKLKEVGGHFVEPNVRVGDQHRPALEALDAWLDSPRMQTALLLGEFGSGKSTVLAHWCAGRAELAADEGSVPVLVDLAVASSSTDAMGAMLAALSLTDDRRHRAAATLLVDSGRLVPCFDGFDEMAGRVGQQGLAERLRDLVQLAANGGKVLIASRDHYFATERELRTTTAEALASALGEAAEHLRLVIQPFEQDQVAKLVHEVRGDAESAQEALSRIAATYDLNDLVRRPLLLAMVLASLDRIDPSARVAPADVYEAYLRRWLEQTAEDEASLSHEQKIRFAEALAEQLWRSGASSCTWKELRKSVRDRIGGLVLPDHLPAGLAFLDVQGGAFFVREGEDKYRFAHRSFLEYFLARALAATLPLRPQDALATRPLTPELVGFIGEVLRPRGEPREAPAVTAVQHWLAGEREGSADATSASRAANAAANALRLLHGLARWSSEPWGWVPEEANLRGVSLIGEDLRGASLRSACLSNADLSGIDLSEADLSGADLRHTRLVNARLDNAIFESADARLADLTMAAADRCQLRGARFDGATLAQSLWTGCEWEGARLDGADLTATVFAGGTSPSSLRAEIMARTANLSATRAVLTTWVSSSPHTIAWAPTGQCFAVGGFQGELTVFDAISGSLLRTFKTDSSYLLAVAFNPSGSILASGAGDGMVWLWEADSGKLLTAFERHEGGVTAVAFDPSGHTLAVGSGSGAIRLWEVATGRLVRTLEGHEGGVTMVAFDPGGRTLAVISGDNTVRLWEVASGQLVRTFGGHRVAFDPSSSTLAVGSGDGAVGLWEAATDQLVHTFERHEGGVTAVAFDPSGHTLAVGSGSGAIRLWEVATGQLVRTLEGHEGGVTMVAFDPSGRMLASRSSAAMVRLWSVSSGELLQTFGGHWRGVSTVAFDPSGHTLVARTSSDTVWLLEMPSSDLVLTRKERLSEVSTVADDLTFDPRHDGDMIRWWEGASSEFLRRLEGRSHGIVTIAFEPSGRTLAFASDDSPIQVWEALSGKLLCSFEGSSGWTRVVAFDAGDRTLASGNTDGTIWLWEVATGRLVRRLEGHEGGVTAVAFDPSGHTLAVGSGSGAIRLWEVATGQLVHTFEGHEGGVTAVVFDPSGHTLAVGSGDGAISLWEVATGQLVHTLEGHKDVVTAVAFAPRGRRLASSSVDGTIRIWNAKHGIPLAVLSSDGDNHLVESHGYFRFDGDDRHLALGLPNPKTPGSTLFLQMSRRLRDVLENPDRVEAALAGNPPSPEQLAADLAAAGLSSPGGAWDGEILRVPAANDDTASGEAGPPHPSENASPRLLGPPAAPAPRLLGPPASPAPRLLAPPEATGSRHLSAPEAPAPSPSPFRPGPALTDVDVLAGREPVVAELSALALCKSPAILVGPRRSGKTSLLRLVERRLKGRNPVRYITLEGSTVTNADDLATLLASDPIATSSPPAGRDERPRDALLRQLRATPTPVPVFLIDEVAHLHQADAELFPWLRALGQEVAGIIFAGSPLDWVSVMRRAATVAPGSSFGNDLTAVVLGSLPEADGERFLVETSGGVIPPEVARWVVELCGPWPFYLQVMGHALFMGAQVGQRRPFLERTALHELYEQRLLVERTAVFEGRWSELPSPVRSALRAHPDARPALRSLPTAVRTQVIDAGLCNVTGAWLSDRPFFDWVRLRAATLDEGSGTNVVT